MKFKSTQILSDGSLFFYENNIISPKIVVLLEKDSKNFKFNKKKEINYQLKSKYSSRNKYTYVSK